MSLRTGSIRRRVRAAALRHERRRARAVLTTRTPLQRLRCRRLPLIASASHALSACGWFAEGLQFAKKTVEAAGEALLVAGVGGDVGDEDAAGGVDHRGALFESCEIMWGWVGGEFDFDGDAFATDLEDEIEFVSVAGAEVICGVWRAESGEHAERLLHDIGLPTCADAWMRAQRLHGRDAENRVEKSCVAPEQFRGFYKAFSEVCVKRGQSTNEKSALDKVGVATRGLVVDAQTSPEFGRVELLSVECCQHAEETRCCLLRAWNAERG